MTTLFEPTPPPSRRQPLRYTLLYIAFGALWIYLSDAAVARFVHNSRLLLLQTSKGILFVAITGLLVFIMLRRLQGHLLAAAERQAELTAHYRVLFDRNPQPILILREVDHRIIATNEAAVRFYGRALADLTASTFETLAGEAGGPDAVRETLPGQPLLARQRLADGTWGEVELHQRLVKLEGSAIWIVMVADVTQRQAQAQALAESEMRFRRIVETAIEGVWVIDTAGETTYVNDQMAAMLGYSPEEMMGRGVIEFMDDEAREQMNRNMARRRMGISERHEFTFLHREGHPVWTLVATTAFLDAQGEFEGALAMISDISELKLKNQKLQEQAWELRENEQRFRMIAGVTNDILWDWDIHRDVFWRSAGFVQILGLASVEPFDLAAWEKLLHPEDAPTVVRSLHDALHGRTESWQAEYRLHRADGGWVRVDDRAQIVRDPHGAAVRMVGGMTDVTERRASEQRIRQLNEELEQRVQERTQELQRSELLHRTLTEAAPQVIWMAAPDGQWSYLNPAWKRLTGRMPEDSCGARWLELVHDEDRARVATAWEHALRNGIVFQTECRIALAIGGWGQISCLGVPVRDAQGRVLRWVGVNTDITARKQAEEEIRNLNEQLRRRGEQLAASNRELETFAYSISHDLRTPLRHIEGFAELLEAVGGAERDENGVRYLRNIRQGAAQLGRMIEDLLAFSRMGRCDLHPQRFDPNGMVQELLESFTHELDDRQVDWRVAPLPELRGDPELIRVVLTNLLTNALKFTRVRTPACIEIGATAGRPGERVLFVRDNGVGFDMKDAHRLFRIFQRLHRAEDFDGTGIGLANVQRIVQRHGGRVWAEAVPGQGAVFFFALPAGEGQAG